MANGARACIGALLVLLVSLPLSAQERMYDALTGDSMGMFGSYRIPVADADSAFVMVYRTFLPATDTSGVRKQAIGWWPWLSAQVKVRGYRFAGIRVVWPTEPTDSLFKQGVATDWWVTFWRDSVGCWHMVNDTTPISNCGS